MAVVSLLVPPISVASALVGVVSSGIGWRRARRRNESNRVAKFCLLGCTAFVILVVVGSAIYAASN